MIGFKTIQSQQLAKKYFPPISLLPPKKFWFGEVPGVPYKRTVLLRKNCGVPYRTYLRLHPTAILGFSVWF